MRICVLVSSYEHSSSELRDCDPLMDPRPWLPGHEVELWALHKATSVAQVRALAARGFDVFLNLCDGTPDEDTAGMEVIETLEALGLAFTGAHRDFVEPSRDDMKRAGERANVRMPRGAVATDPRDAATIAAELRFPMIVKHPRSFGSIGMTRASRVETPGELEHQLARMIGAYGSALVEEFIEGREYTVLVAEPGEGEHTPRAYPPLEEAFPAGETFKHFDLKWSSYHSIRWLPVTDDVLAAGLIHAASALFTALGGSGYGRCDIRVDDAGRIFVLEINPNCGIFYAPEDPGSADVILARAPGGHVAFLEHILGAALRRRERAAVHETVLRTS